ncbi:MAG: hypothetical protein ACFFDF_19670 [Candidatus Odinarchaeota archaeon]
MIVILSYFHAKIGPAIFYSFPKRQLEKSLYARIYDVMDQPSKEEFLTQTFENSKLLNYYFQIYSDWARGKKEMVMFSILIYQQISPEIEKSISDLCKEFSEKMQTTEEIFTGLHRKDMNSYDQKEKELIKKNDYLIRSWVRELYWEILKVIKKISEEERITLLLDDRYIIESLEEMSRELKKITEEINLNEDSSRVNPKIKKSISKLSKIINDLNEGYIEKMTNIDIESDFSVEEEFDIDIQNNKKAFLKTLHGEFDIEEGNNREGN